MDTEWISSDKLNLVVLGRVVSCELEALAGALCRMLDLYRNDKPAHANMGANARCLTQIQYSPQAVTAKLMAAYDSILN